MGEFGNYPMVGVRLDWIGRDELFALLEGSWRMTAPPSLVAGYEG